MKSIASELYEEADTIHSRSNGREPWKEQSFGEFEKILRGRLRSRKKKPLK